MDAAGRPHFHEETPAMKKLLFLALLGLAVIVSQSTTPIAPPAPPCNAPMPTPAPGASSQMRPMMPYNMVQPAGYRPNYPANYGYGYNPQAYGMGYPPAYGYNMPN